MKTTVTTYFDPAKSIHHIIYTDGKESGLRAMCNEHCNLYVWIFDTYTNDELADIAKGANPFARVFNSYRMAKEYAKERKHLARKYDLPNDELATCIRFVATYIHCYLAKGETNVPE